MRSKQMPGSERLWQTIDSYQKILNLLDNPRNSAIMGSLLDNKKGLYFTELYEEVNLRLAGEFNQPEISETSLQDRSMKLISYGLADREKVPCKRGAYPYRYTASDEFQRFYKKAYAAMEMFEKSVQERESEEKLL